MNTTTVQDIPKAMAVFDRLGHQLGHVDYVQTPNRRRADLAEFEAGLLDNRQMGWDFGDDILELGFGGDDLFDDSLVNRMETYGYLYIVMAEGEGAFVLGDEIDHVEDGGLYLNVESYHLIHHAGASQALSITE